MLLFMISTTRLMGSIHDHRKCRKQSANAMTSKPKKKSTATKQVPVSKTRPISTFIAKSRHKIHKLLLPNNKNKKDDDCSVPLLPV